MLLDFWKDFSGSVLNEATEGLISRFLPIWTITYVFNYILRSWTSLCLRVQAMESTRIGFKFQFCLFVAVWLLVNLTSVRSIFPVMSKNKNASYRQCENWMRQNVQLVLVNHATSNSKVSVTCSHEGGVLLMLHPQPRLERGHQSMPSSCKDQPDQPTISWSLPLQSRR